MRKNISKDGFTLNDFDEGHPIHTLKKENRVIEDLIENNEWVTSKTINVDVYDSGPDSGPTFPSPADPTIPRVPVFEITTPPLAVNNVVIPMGSITLTKLE